MNRSRIPWLVNADGTPGYTWSPMTGCGPGLPCYERCWARAYHVRYRGGDFSVKLHPEKLDEPLRLRKPSTIGVCLMGDLFHDDVPDEFIISVFATMARANRHRFVLLTKRPERMKRSLFSMHIHDGTMLGRLWSGVSVEDQATSDERIGVLVDTPAAHRFVSLEPQLGPVDLEKWVRRIRTIIPPDFEVPGLDLVIQGCESGPRRRPFDIAWARSMRDQCKVAGVSYALKQMPDRIPGSHSDGVCGAGLGSKVIEKPELDGKVEWNLPWEVSR